MISSEKASLVQFSKCNSKDNHWHLNISTSLPVIITKIKILQSTFIHSMSVERMAVFNAGPAFTESISERFAVFFWATIIQFLQRYMLFKYEMSPVCIPVKWFPRVGKPLWWWLNQGNAMKSQMLLIQMCYNDQSNETFLMSHFLL